MFWARMTGRTIKYSMRWQYNAIKLKKRETKHSVQLKRPKFRINELRVTLVKKK